MTDTSRCWAARIYADDAYVSAILRVARKVHLTYLSPARGVVFHEVRPLSEISTARDLMYRGKPYPIPRFLKSLRRSARTHGITAAAKKELRTVSAFE